MLVINDARYKCQQTLKLNFKRKKGMIMVKKKFFLLGDEEKKNLTEIECVLLSLKHFISKESRCLHANIMMPT